VCGWEKGGVERVNLMSMRERASRQEREGDKKWIKSAPSSHRLVLAMIHFRIKSSGTCLVKKKSRCLFSNTSRLYIECLVKSNTFITTSLSN